MARHNENIMPALGEAVKMKLSAGKTRLISKIDPLNIIKSITGSPLLTAAVGRMTGRAARDISYFTGGKYGAYGDPTDEQGMGKSPMKADGVYHTRIGSGKISGRLKAGDGIADILAKTYNLLRMQYDEQKRLGEIKSQFDEEKEYEAKKAARATKIKEMDLGEKEVPEMEEKGLFGSLWNTFEKWAGIEALRRLMKNRLKSFFVFAFKKLPRMLLSAILPRSALALLGELGLATQLLSPIELGDATFDKERAEYDLKAVPMTEEQKTKTLALNTELDKLQKELKNKDITEDRRQQLRDKISEIQKQKREMLKQRREQYKSENKFVPSGSTAFGDSMPVNEREQRAMDFFLSRDWTREQAAGIVGNLSRESAGLNPSIVNPTSGAYGIAQWLGDRKKKLFEMYGPNPSLEQQLEFVDYELKGGEPSVRDAGPLLKKAKTVQEATSIMAHKFEKPFTKDMPEEVVSEDMRKRFERANQLFLPAVGPVEETKKIEEDNVDTKREARKAKMLEMEKQSKAIREMNDSQLGSRLQKSQSEFNNMSDKSAQNVIINAPQTNTTVAGGGGGKQMVSKSEPRNDDPVLYQLQYQNFSRAIV